MTTSCPTPRCSTTAGTRQDARGQPCRLVLLPIRQRHPHRVDLGEGGPRGARRRSGERGWLARRQELRRRLCSNNSALDLFAIGPPSTTSRPPTRTINPKVGAQIRRAQPAQAGPEQVSTPSLTSTALSRTPGELAPAATCLCEPTCRRLSARS